MTRSRRYTVIAILLFAALAVAMAFFRGRAARVYAPVQITGQASHPAEILNIWRANGVRGRIAVLFTANIAASADSGVSLDGTLFDRALNSGIARRGFHVVPDSGFSKVYSEILQIQTPSPLKTTENGFALLFESGRVDIIPFSRFTPPDEPFLIVMQPGIWNMEQRAMIERLRSSSDIFLIVP